MTLESRIKAEAYELLGLDSLKYESMPNGPEYTHYLSLSYAISELVQASCKSGFGKCRNRNGRNSLNSGY